MPILEYMCEACKKPQEVFIPYEVVTPCGCGGEMRRAYLTAPQTKIGFKKDVKCQVIGKNGDRPTFTTKYQMKEWGKKNGVDFIHRDNFNYDD